MWETPQGMGEKVCRNKTIVLRTVTVIKSKRNIFNNYSPWTLLRKNFCAPHFSITVFPCSLILFRPLRLLSISLKPNLVAHSLQIFCIRLFEPWSIHLLDLRPKPILTQDYLIPLHSFLFHFFPLNTFHSIPFHFSQFLYNHSILFLYELPNKCLVSMPPKFIYISYENSKMNHKFFSLNGAFSNGFFPT